MENDMYGKLSCLQCMNKFETQLGFVIHKCYMEQVFKSVKIDLSTVKQTRWQRFWIWFYSLDFGYIAAFIGLLMMNGIFIHHFDLSFPESLIESFGLGLAASHLLK